MSAKNGNGASGEEDAAEFSASDEPVTETASEASQIEALLAEVAALKDRSLRALAEAENMRKRAEREIEETRQFAIARFARDLLSVSDNLRRALAATPPEARSGADDSLRAVIEGVEATERELQAVLIRHGVKAIAAAGTKFDPNLHQAVAEVPGNGQPAGTVVNVIQDGYVIGERLLRAAMVTIAKAEPSGS
jgi:molecular chaperone GrpE